MAIPYRGGKDWLVWWRERWGLNLWPLKRVPLNVKRWDALTQHLALLRSVNFVGSPSFGCRCRVFFSVCFGIWNFAIISVCESCTVKIGNSFFWIFDEYFTRLLDFGGSSLVIYSFWTFNAFWRSAWILLLLSKDLLVRVSPLGASCWSYLWILLIHLSFKVCLGGTYSKCNRYCVFSRCCFDVH